MIFFSYSHHHDHHHRQYHCCSLFSCSYWYCGSTANLYAVARAPTAWLGWPPDICHLGFVQSSSRQFVPCEACWQATVVKTSMMKAITLALRKPGWPDLLKSPTTALSHVQAAPCQLSAGLTTCMLGLLLCAVLVNTIAMNCTGVSVPMQELSAV